MSLAPIGADRQAKIRSLFEMQNKSSKQNATTCGIRGDNLAATLRDAIEDMMSDDMPRGDVISDMASAASIDVGTVNQIVPEDPGTDVSINCPPMARLEGFASALEIPVERLISAAEDDGCTYE